MLDLNASAYQLTESLTGQTERLHIQQHTLVNGGTILDFGVKTTGGLQAGLILSNICMANLGWTVLSTRKLCGQNWPYVQVSTDHALAACLLSQYAGWELKVDDYFGMGSGPMRVAAAVEELVQKLNATQQSDHLVGVLETGELPGENVLEHIANAADVSPESITLCVAPTASQAGNIQIVARTVETAMHKLYELGFDVTQVVSGFGSAPLPPVADNDLVGIGRTNDAILCGSSVTLWVNSEDDLLSEIGPKVPSSASDAYGSTFLKLFQQANHDFYALDPMLFGPAQTTFQNLKTGNVFRFGQYDDSVIRKSFGLE